MAFTEELKLEVKKKSHFSCCLCHTLGVEIHHIIPQAEGGSDTEDNAAPLCPTCHEIYGANQQKRKFIREARDFWYELCVKRYSGDSAVLYEISKRVEQTASKADLQAAIDTMANLVGKKEISNELVMIELPIRYWVIILAALNPLIESVKLQIDELRALGYSYDDAKKLPQELVTAMSGTILARGTIIDALINKGVMKSRIPGANAIMEQVNRVAQEQKTK